MKTLLSLAALAASLLTALPATGKSFQTYSRAGHISSHTIGHSYGSPRVRHYTATTRSDYRGRPLGVTRSRITMRRQPGAYRHPRLAARPGHYRIRAHTVRHASPRLGRYSSITRYSYRGRTVGTSRSHITFRRR